MQQIDSVIPDESFSGIGVVDWEKWEPLFEVNNFVPKWKVYVTESKKLVRLRHPDWSDEQIFEQARIEFETAAQ